MTRTGIVLGPLCALMFAGVMVGQTPAAGAPVGKVDFATDVLPILRTNCVECHGPLKQRAGMRLDRRSSVMKEFTRRVVPGSSANSFLYHRVMGEYGSQMPPDGALKADQIAILKAWIDQGAEWPDALANEIDRPAPDAKAIAMVEMLVNGDLAGLYEGGGNAEPSLLNARGPEGSTPFMYAVLYANAATLRELLKKGADPNRANDANATALMWAVQDLEKTRLLVEHGAEVNAKSDDLKTPLMIAARHPGGEATVKLLLQHGANPTPNAKPETESSPLLEAATAGDAGEYGVAAAAWRGCEGGGRVGTDDGRVEQLPEVRGPDCGEDHEQGCVYGVAAGHCDLWRFAECANHAGPWCGCEGSRSAGADRADVCGDVRVRCRWRWCSC